MRDPVQALGAIFRERYEIQGALGEGGFGTVYKAVQLATGQAVAIKVLRLPEGGTEQGIEKRVARFQREMQICAQMHHPNIVGLIDSGQAEGGIVYSIFEFLPGENLAELLLKERRLEPVEARHFMVQVLDALSCAHGAGVVHRDLKPANIMILATGARRNAVVLDFGISALTAEAQRDEGARLTVTNECIGTPAYAAPEQLRGHPPTPRTDLYAWGLVFLECLTGRRVFDGQAFAEIVYEQLSPDPIPIPSAIADHALGRILRRVTVKDAASRDATADALLREVEGCDLSGLNLPPEIAPVEWAHPHAPTVTLQGSTPLAPATRTLVDAERHATPAQPPAALSPVPARPPPGKAIIDDPGGATVLVAETRPPAVAPPPGVVRAVPQRPKSAAALLAGPGFAVQGPASRVGAANMVFVFLPQVADGGLMLLAHTSRPPSDAEWGAYCAEIGRLDLQRVKSVAFTDGGAPNSSQRKQVNKLLAGKMSRASVVSSSTFVHHVVTGLSWFNSQVRAFSPHQVDAALQYVGVRADELGLVHGEIQRLRDRLGGGVAPR